MLHVVEAQDDAKHCVMVPGQSLKCVTHKSVLVRGLHGLLGQLALSHVVQAVNIAVVSAI